MGIQQVEQPWEHRAAIARAGHAVTARAASGQHCDAPEWSGDDLERWGAGDPEGLANAAGSVQYARRRGHCDREGRAGGRS